MRSYKLIGLTGRSGSGKSVVRGVFEEEGYKVIDADLLARRALESPVVLIGLKAYFGSDIINGNTLDRKSLAEKAFRDKENTAKLNSVMHPEIVRLFLGDLKDLIISGESKILFDAPQLFEAGMEVLCDLTVAVIADDELRLRRITERDNISRAEAESRLRVQLDDSFFKNECDYYLENNNSEQELKSKTRELISRI